MYSVTFSVILAALTATALGCDLNSQSQVQCDIDIAEQSCKDPQGEMAVLCLHLKWYLKNAQNKPKGPVQPNLVRNGKGQIRKLKLDLVDGLKQSLEAKTQAVTATKYAIETVIDKGGEFMGKLGAYKETSKLMATCAKAIGAIAVSQYF